MISPIKEILQTLGRHGQTVEDALVDVVSHHSGAPSASILALRQVSALRAAGADGYRLHPRLREYLQDHLQIYPAFQSLSDIGSRITNIRVLWTELDQMYSSRSADLDTIDGLEDSLRSGVFDIVDSMERNMILLQTLMSSRYGNVKSLALKQSQNRYYQGQTQALAGEVVRLSKVAGAIEREASHRSAEAVALFMRRHLLSRLHLWQEGVSEIQTQIRQDINRTRQIERQNKQLARMDMVLRQQPAWRGIDPDLSGEIPDFLLAARMPAFRAHVEPLDSDRSMVQEMLDIVGDMPPKRIIPDPQPPKRIKRIFPEESPPAEVPGEKALDRLIADVLKASQGVSLAQWRMDDEEAMAMDPGVWLVFAAMTLPIAGDFKVSLASDPPRKGEHFSHTFSDAFAYSRALYESTILTGALAPSPAAGAQR